MDRAGRHHCEFSWAYSELVPIEGEAQVALDDADNLQAVVPMKGDVGGKGLVRIVEANTVAKVGHHAFMVFSFHTVHPFINTVQLLQKKKK